MAELLASEERRDRGEPAHLPEMLARLMRVAIARNTALEERSAAEKDVSVQELAALRDDVVELARRHAAPWRRRAERHARSPIASPPRSSRSGTIGGCR